MTHLNQYNVVYLEITSFISEARTLQKPLIEVPGMIMEAVHDDLLRMYPDLPKLRTVNDELLYCAEKPDGRPFVFIIDEWDAVIREAKEEEEAQQAYLNLLRGWFKSGTFTPKAVAVAYMTGILPIKKDGKQR